MSLYYPAGKSSTNPVLRLQDKDSLPPIVPPCEVFFVNPNTSYYAVGRILIARQGYDYPLTTQIQSLQPEHSQGVSCEVSPSFGLTNQSISIENGGSNHTVGDIYFIYNSTENNDPATLEVTEVDENGAILDFNIILPGSDFDNNGIVVSSDYPSLFDATFSLNINKFCISKCIINEAGSGFAPLDSSGLPIERKLVLTNYGSGAGFYAVALPPALSYDSDNNPIFPPKTHYSDPNIQIASNNNRPIFRFDISSQSWTALNQNNGPSCESDGGKFWTVVGTLGGSLGGGLYGFLKWVESQNRQVYDERLASILDNIRELIKKEATRGLTGSSTSTTLIDDIIEYRNRPSIGPVGGHRGPPAWSKPWKPNFPYIFDINDTTFFINSLDDAANLPEPARSEALRIALEDKARWESAIARLREQFDGIIKDRTFSLNDRLRSILKEMEDACPGAPSRLKMQDLINQECDFLYKQLIDQIDSTPDSTFAPKEIEPDKIKKVADKTRAIAKQAVEEIVETVRSNAVTRISGIFPQPQVQNAAKCVKTNKQRFTFKFKLKRNTSCGPKRGKGGTAGAIGLLVFLYGLSEAYADSETNEELVEAVISQIVSSLQPLPSPPPPPSVEEAFQDILQNTELLLKQYYLGQISDQELIDQWWDIVGDNLNRLYREETRDALLQDPRFIELTDLITGGNLKELADDVANQTEWPGDFSFPWNLDRQVISERTRRQKMLEFTIFLQSEIMDKFSKLPCDNFCGSGSNQETTNLQEFIGPPGSDSGLTEQDILGLILQMQSNNPESYIEEYYKE